MKKVEKLLSELAPGVDFTSRIGPPVQLPEEKEKEDFPKAGNSIKSNGSGQAGNGLVRNELAHSILPSDPVEREKYVAKLGGRFAPRSEDSDKESQDSYNEDEVALVQTCERFEDNLADFKIMLRGRQDEETSMTPASRASEEEKRKMTSQDSVSFLGNSNTIHLVHGLEKMRGEDNVMQQILQGMRPAFWRVPVSLSDPPLSQERRAEALQKIIDQAWPPPDLEQKLLDLYFTRINNDYPILSESIFRAEVANPANRRDSDWLMLAMTVFAVSSRFTDDERVLDKTRTDDMPINTRGSRFYNACRSMSFCPITPSPSLRWIQMMLLATVFVLGTALAQNVGWNLLGTVFRVLYFAGAHRKITAIRMRYPIMTQEAWRRTWWTAYSLEREMSTILGRPAAVQDEDFDVEYPLEVDDKYLLAVCDKGGVPAQPPQKPALVSGFVCSLKLDVIMGRTLRTIYAIGKAKVSRGLVGKGWDQLIVADIDSSLNHWLDTVPNHLRYNQSEPNDEWLLQSSMLYSKYYYCQILVHRPFIAGPKMSSSLNYPSLAITTNAAKSTVQVLHTLLKRGLVNLGGHIAAGRAFEAGCVLLVVVVGSRKNGLRVPSSTHSDIKRCLEILAALEEKWTLAGKLTDLLKVLCNAFNVEAVLEDNLHAVSKRKADGEGSTAPVSEMDCPSTDVSQRPVRAGRRSERNSSDERRFLPFSTRDLGLSPPTSDSGNLSNPSQTPSTASPKNAHESVVSSQQEQLITHAEASISVQSQAPSTSQTYSQSTWFSEAPGVSSPRGNFDLSLLGGDLDQDAFASFVSDMSAPTFTPLDLPTFSSAFLTQGPGANGGVMPTGGDMNMDQRVSNGGNGVASALTPGFGGLYAVGFDFSGQFPGDPATRKQQSFVQAPQQSEQPSNDPFNNVFRDLWVSQDFYHGSG